MPLPPLRANGDHFVDDKGRWVLLRGVNLGGDSKVPFPDGGTQFFSDFSDHRQVSFVGRPFPLEQAAEHFSRLQTWGFNCLRLLTTWEAVEHAGPGHYDEAYIDYFAEICQLAGQYGLYVFVDFHQDVWSRMTGGDGAPGWIFAELGIDRRVLDRADMALVMQQRYDYSDSRKRQPDNYPMMSWFQNYEKPANAILWTLFFAGRDFAPQKKIRGVNVQDYLQDHLIACQVQLARAIAQQPHVLGFNVLNEPSQGWIGVAMDDHRDRATAGHPVRPGIAWSPLAGLDASTGHSVELNNLQVSLLKRGCVPVGKVTANPEKLSMWLRESDEPFAAAGAWCRDQNGAATIGRRDFFQRVGDRTVHFDRDYLFPFINRATQALRSVKPEWMIFVEQDAHNMLAEPSFPENTPQQMVNANHWYDILTLLRKRFAYPVSVDVTSGKPVLGEGGIQRMYKRQLATLKRASASVPGGCPTLVGEFGIPFDLFNRRAYRAFARGDRSQRHWKPHIRALDLMYNALDELLLSSTQWNYSAANQNDARVGDNWNQEDLSIFSADQKTCAEDPYSGARAAAGFVRPYARAVSGTPIRMQFDRRRGWFELEYRASVLEGAATEIFVPRLQFPRGFLVDAKDARVEAQGARVEHSGQIVRVFPKKAGPALIRIRRRR